MLKKFTDFSQLTKAVLKKADAVRAAVPHPQKLAPAPAPEAAAETALSREDADCLAYFSHTSIADSRFATAGRVRTPVAPKRDPESRAENGDRAALAALQVSEARLTEQLAEVQQALVAAEARAVAAESELANRSGLSSLSKLCLAAALVLFGSAARAASLDYAIVNDHADLLYACGERASFTVTVKEKGGAVPTAGVVSAQLDNFGPHEVASATWDLAVTNVFTLSGALAEPGFLRLTLRAKDTADKVWSVGYAPEKIRKGSPSPADFDNFWTEAREKVAREVPLDPQLVRVPERCTDQFDFYRLSVATYGRRVHGLLTVPKKGGRHPVDFGINAAGFGGWTNDLSGRSDAVCVQMSVYPFEMDWNWEKKGLRQSLFEPFQAKMKKTYGAECWQAGIVQGRETYFYYPVILAIDRVVDWLAEQPYVEPQRFRYQGTSQGGGLGIMLVGLNRHFACAAFYVPAITDTLGHLKGRQSGWPRITESYGTAEEKAAVLKHAPYFDAANFMSRIACPVRVAVGFADTTCPPCAVYAAYNELKVEDKAIRHGFGMGHGCFGRFYDELGAWTRGF